MLSMILNLFVLLSFGVAFIDVYGNPFTIQKITTLDSSVFLIISMSIVLMLRLFYKQAFLLPYVSRLLLILFIISLSTSLLLTKLEFITPPNYIYSLLPINAQRLFFISLVSGFFVFLQQPNTWFKQYRTQIIFSFSLIIPLVFYVLSLFPYNLLLEISREDNIVENLQFFTLLIATFFSAKIALKLVKRKAMTIALIFSIISAGLFFISGDEISWGQRLFGLETPTVIAQYNAQQELSWHNLVQVGNLPTYAYIFIGFYGSFFWLFKPLLKHSSVLMLIVPRQLFFYFFVPLLFQIRFIIGNHHLGVWAEPSELILYMGTALYMYCIYSLLTTKKNNLFYSSTPI